MARPPPPRPRAYQRVIHGAVDGVRTCNCVGHGWTTEGLYAEQQQLCQAVLPRTFPEWYCPLILLDVDSFVCVSDRRSHRIVALRAKSVVVAASMGIGWWSVKLRHVDVVKGLEADDEDLEDFKL